MHIETKAVVRIMNDQGNFLTLNDGTKIDKQLFAQKYAPLQTESVDSKMNATDFMNQKTNIQVNPQKNQATQPTDEGIISPSGVVDAIDFLNSPSSVQIDGLENLKKIDTTKHLDMPEDSRRTIRDLSQEKT